MDTVVYALNKKEFLGFKRVSYGKANTPENLREYRLEDNPASPVGTRKEIREFMEKRTNGRFVGVALVDFVNKVKFIEYVLTEDLPK